MVGSLSISLETAMQILEKKTCEKVGCVSG